MFKLIKNAEVYAPESLGVNDILICNDKIIKIAPNITWDFPGTEVIDATGKKAVPGFIDQHVHITGGGGESGFTTKVTEIGLSDIVRGGVTTLCGVLGTDSLSRNVESVLAKTKALNEEGLTVFCYTGSYDCPSPTITGDIAKDLAFIDEVIGVKICISDHRYAGTTKEDLTRIAARARVAGLIGHKPGVTHIHMGRGKRGLKDVFEILEETDIPIKNFRPTHASNQPEDIEKFALMGGYVDFTASPQAPKDMLDMMNKVPENLVTLSSDSNGSMPKWNEKNELIGIEAAAITALYEVIERMVKELDVPMERALLPITKNVAVALEVYPRKGALQADSDADIVLLDNDLKIESVFAKGKQMMADHEPLVKGYFEK